MVNRPKSRYLQLGLRQKTLDIAVNGMCRSDTLYSTGHLELKIFLRQIADTINLVRSGISKQTFALHGKNW